MVGKGGFSETQHVRPTGSLLPLLHHEKGPLVAPPAAGCPVGKEFPAVATGTEIGHRQVVPADPGLPQDPRIGLPEVQLVLARRPSPRQDAGDGGVQWFRPGKSLFR